MKHLAVLVVALAAGSSACVTLADQQGRLEHAKFDALALPADAPPEARVAAAAQAATTNSVEVIEVDKDGNGLLVSPVGLPVMVAGQAVWWLDDLAPLIAPESPAAAHLKSHVEHRDAALAYDSVFLTGSGIASVAAIGGLAGLGWLLFLNGGDPAFYTTLALTAGGSAAAVGTFAAWYGLVFNDHLEARKEKIELMATYQDGVARRYRVKLTPVPNEPGKVTVTPE